MKLCDLLDQLLDFEEDIDGVASYLNSTSTEFLSLNIDNVRTDHRNVNENSIYVALLGNRYNSHSFIDEARKNGANFVIGQRGAPSSPAPDLQVKNSRAVIGPLANILSDFPSKKMSVVGITGTNGKTSVSYLYSSMVQQQKTNCFTMGTTGILLNGEKESDSQTTPDPLSLQVALSDFLSENVLFGAMEVSSHALDQYRVLGTCFTAVAFTNFSQDHLDYHKDMDSYFASKAKLFDPKFSKVAVVNIDDSKGPTIVQIAQSNHMEILRVSAIDENAEVYVHANKSDLSGIEGEVRFNKNSANPENINFSTSMIGDFNLENIGVAFGLALANNLDLSVCAQSLKQAKSAPGRLQRPPSSSGYSVFIDYAHTPDALERVLRVVKPLCKKLIVVFGCGGDRDKSKRPIMGKIASSIADKVIVTNDNPRSEDGASIANEITQGAISEIEIVLDRREAIQKAIEWASEGDAVIIAGKGHEKGQIFASEIIDFSDLDVANEILGRKTSDF